MSKSAHCPPAKACLSSQRAEVGLTPAPVIRKDSGHLAQFSQNYNTTN